MEERDWLFLIEVVFLYGGLMAFGLWQVLKMRRDLREIRAKKAEKQQAEKQQAADAAQQPDTPQDGDGNAP